MNDDFALYEYAYSLLNRRAASPKKKGPSTSENELLSHDAPSESSQGDTSLCSNEERSAAVTGNVVSTDGTHQSSGRRDSGNTDNETVSDLSSVTSRGSPKAHHRIMTNSSSDLLDELSLSSHGMPTMPSTADAISGLSSTLSSSECVGVVCCPVCGLDLSDLDTFLRNKHAYSCGEGGHFSFASSGASLPFIPPDNKANDVKASKGVGSGYSQPNSTLSVSAKSNTAIASVLSKRSLLPSASSAPKSKKSKFQPHVPGNKLVTSYFSPNKSASPSTGNQSTAESNPS